jgi:hypothetical protein
MSAQGYLNLDAGQVLRQFKRTAGGEGVMRFEAQ